MGLMNENSGQRCFDDDDDGGDGGGGDGVSMAFTELLVRLHHMDVH